MHCEEETNTFTVFVLTVIGKLGYLKKLDTFTIAEEACGMLIAVTHYGKHIPIIGGDDDDDASFEEFATGLQSALDWHKDNFGKKVDMVYPDDV